MDVRPLVEQEPDEFGHVAVCGPEQGGFTPHTALVHVRPLFQQAGGHAQRAGLHRPHQRRESGVIRGSGVDLGPMLHEELHQLQSGLFILFRRHDGTVEGGVAVLGAGVDIRSLLQQQACHVAGGNRGRVHEGGAAAVVRGVDRGPPFEQETHHLRRIALCGEHEGGLALVGSGVELGPPVEQQAHHVESPLIGRRMQEGIAVGIPRLHLRALAEEVFEKRGLVVSDGAEERFARAGILHSLRTDGRRGGSQRRAFRARLGSHAEQNVNGRLAILLHRIVECRDEVALALREVAHGLPLLMVDGRHDGRSPWAVHAEA